MEKPPALPVKQHRRSSVDSDCALISPVGFQHPNHAFNDVFPDPTDCHAAQCPIHQRYDPSRHQLRFFSDDVPPPVPKKRLARTFSHPAVHVSSLPPLSPLHPLNFDNPLYMMAASCFHEETEEVESSRMSPVSSPSISQLSFDTPDQHLPFLFGGFTDQTLVSRGIQHRQLLFLRSASESVEAGMLLQGDASYRPQDFLLCEARNPKQIGDAVYYDLQSSRFPGRLLGLRIHKQTEASTGTKHHPPHVNIQHVIASFPPSKTTLQTDPRAASSGGSSSTEPETVQDLLQKGLGVSVERDLPQSTLEDLVRLSGSQCSHYDRLVCVVLLQVLMGSQHLYHSGGGAAAELRPQEVLLVWEEDQEEEEPCRIQMLRRNHGSPRVLLKPRSSPQPLEDVKLQIVALIRFCLNPEESSAASPSSYRLGLLHVSSLLQSHGGGGQMLDGASLLQVLLWGPRVPLLSSTSTTSTTSTTSSTAHNWLSIKRALLVMKLAERGLIQDQSALDWEDWLCLQYLSFTDSETIESVAGRLWKSEH